MVAPTREEKTVQVSLESKDFFGKLLKDIIVDILSDYCIFHCSMVSLDMLDAICSKLFFTGDDKSAEEFSCHILAAYPKLNDCRGLEILKVSGISRKSFL